MKRFIALLLLFALAGCASHPLGKPPAVQYEQHNPQFKD